MAAGASSTCICSFVKKNITRRKMEVRILIEQKTPVFILWNALKSRRHFMHIRLPEYSLSGVGTRNKQVHHDLQMCAIYFQ